MYADLTIFAVILTIELADNLKLVMGNFEIRPADPHVKITNEAHKTP